MFDRQVKLLVEGYAERPDEFCNSLRKFIGPIRKEIFDLDNRFDGRFESRCQSNSVPKKVLLLVSALIDGLK